MGTSISALLIISVLLTAVVIMFKANQIGAELLAVANKSAAETIADRVSTKIEISSTQDFKASYELATKHNPNDAEGCKPIYSGLSRQGILITTNEIDCFWFIGPEGATARFTLDKIMTSPVETDKRATGNSQVSLDYLGLGAEISNAPQTYGNPYTDLNPGNYHWESSGFTLTGASTEENPYRFKIWSATVHEARNEGGYSVLLTIDGVDSIDLSAVACVKNFHWKNSGSTSFTVSQLEEKLDIFVILNTAAGATDMKVPVKGSVPLQSNQWTYSISDDNYQVGTFNPGESITMTINLNGELQVAGTLLVTLPNGVGTSHSFPSICTM